MLNGSQSLEDCFLFRIAKKRAARPSVQRVGQVSEKEVGDDSPFIRDMGELAERIDCEIWERTNCATFLTYVIDGSGSHV